MQKLAREELTHHILAFQFDGIISIPSVVQPQPVSPGAACEEQPNPRVRRHAKVGSTELISAERAREPDSCRYLIRYGGSNS